MIQGPGGTAALLLCLFPIVQAAEDGPAGPRQEQLLALRRAKAARVEPYRPTFLERQLLAFEKAERPAIYEVNLWDVYPRIQTIDHRSQWAGGVRLWKPDLGDSRFDVAGAAFWSLQGFQYYEVQAGLVPHRGRAMPLFANRADDVFELPNVRSDDDDPRMLYASYGYRWAPKFDYWGTGIDAPPDGQADFLQKDDLWELTGGYRLKRWLTAGVRAGYHTVSIGAGRDDDLPSLETVYDDESAPGLDDQPDYWRTGVYAVADTRDVARNPHRGALLAALFTRYDDRGGDAFRFDRVAADARLFLPLGHPQRVLVLRAYFSQDDPAPGARVPFYLLAWLGNSKTLRAYDSQRFRGERLALFQAEYRVEASPALELALFADSGTVAARRSDPLSDFRTDFGVGLRVKTHEAVLVRLDAAWGDEGFKLGLRFSPSF